MQKHIKKLKKHLYKKYTKYSEEFKDQLYYVKNILSDAGDSLLISSKIIALGVFVLVLSLAAGFYHQSYIEKKVGSNTLYLRSPDGAQIQGSGTGFEVQAPSGKVYTVTNAHVCGLQKDGFILAAEKRHSHRLVPIRVLEVYEKNDLCLLEGLQGYEGLKLGARAEIGQSVWAVGYPMGRALDISRGRVKNFAAVDIIDQETPLNKCIKEGMHITTGHFLFWDFQVCVITREAIETSATIFPGSSGSPLVNVYGNVVGVVFAADNTTHWGDAVILEDLQKLLSAY